MIMKKNIEIMLNELAVRINNNKPDEPDMEMCLAYMEGCLDKNETILVENFLMTNDNVVKLMSEIKHLMTTSNQVKLPRSLHNKLIETLGYAEETVFNIILKKVKGQLEILEGMEWLIPSPQVAFRNEDNQQLILKKNIGKFSFEWNCKEKNERIHSRCLVSNQDGLGEKNIRFDIYTGEKIISSQVSNDTGNTKNMVFPKGKHSIKIYEKSRFLGTIDIAFSSQD